MSSLSAPINPSLLPASFLTPMRALSLRDAVRFVRRRLALILSVIALCIVAAYFAASAIAPQYRAESVVMQDMRKNSATDLGMVMASFSGDYTAELRSEMDIIASRSVLDRVIARLQLNDDPEFAPKPRKAGLLARLMPWRHETATVGSETMEENRANAVYHNIADRLKVTNDGRSLSIHITFESADPHKAALIANTVTEEYLNDQLEAKYQTTERINKWLDERLGALKKQVESSEKSVESFRQKARLIEVDGSTVVSRQMEDVNSQLVDARAETSQAEARLHSAQAMLRSSKGAESVADVLSSPLIQRLREQEAELRRKEAEMASKYGSLHPKMIDVRAEYQDLQNKIAEEVGRIIQNLENQVSIAQAKENQLKSDMQRLEDKAGVEMKDSVTLRQLEREAEANRTLYQNFLARFKQSAEQKDLQIADSRIIARAEAPLEASFPKKWLFMLVGGLLGAVFGLFAAWLTEYFARGYRSAEQLENDTSMRVIGIVPAMKGKEGAAADFVLKKPLSAYAEVLRSVRTAVHFSNHDAPPRTIMVTSALPAEGKTTFSLSLARTLAMAGNKILLIDADMRRPSLARVLKLDKLNNGLTQLLEGKAEFSQVVQPDPKLASLHVIPTLREHNTQGLLTSLSMKQLLENASKIYDLVIIDTPPMLAVSDAALITTLVDTTILLVRWGVTPREKVLRTYQLLKSYGCRFAGIVLSQVDLHEHVKYGEEHYQHNYHEYYVN